MLHSFAHSDFKGCALLKPSFQMRVVKRLSASSLAWEGGCLVSGVDSLLTAPQPCANRREIAGWGLPQGEVTKQVTKVTRSNKNFLSFVTASNPYSIRVSAL